MWRAFAFVNNTWKKVPVFGNEDAPFTPRLVRELGRENLLDSHPALLRQLDHEAENQGRFSREAIELWSRAAENEAREFVKQGFPKIKAIDEALGLYPSTNDSSPLTLAWHDPGLVIVPLSGDEQRVVVEYETDPRFEKRNREIYFRYASGAHELETILDWRGYFGRGGAVIDGWSTMHRSGRGFTVGFRGTPGFIVGSVLRRLTRPASALRNDPTAERRLARMVAKYPRAAAACPDLAQHGPIKAERVIVFVHGPVACGILGLKDLFPEKGTPPGLELCPVFRYEHDTFLPIGDNAAELAELIRTQVSAEKLLLVGHSRGGLVARLAHGLLQESAYPAEISVMTMGTPHLGMPLISSNSKALNLLFKQGEDFASNIPLLSPLTSAYSYLLNSSSLPKGIEVLGERTDTSELALALDGPDNARSWAGNFDPRASQAGFGIELDGALLGTHGFGANNDLVVPTASALAYGKPERPLRCAHDTYFVQQEVQQALTNFSTAIDAEEDEEEDEDEDGRR